MIVSVLAVYPHDCVADQEQKLVATAHHHKIVSDPISLPWEKMKIQSTVSTDLVSLLYIVKPKKKKKS